MDGEKSNPLTSPIPDPVTHPTIKIGDVDFQVRFTMLQVMRLEESGIKFTETYMDGTVPKERPRQVWNLRDIFTGLAVMISTTAKKYTAEEVAELIPHENAAEVMAVFASAVKKVLSQAKRPTTTLPPAAGASQPRDN